MNAMNPLSRVLFLVAVFLFALPGTSAYAQKTGEIPRIPASSSPTPNRGLITPDFKFPTQDKGGVERTPPIFREGIEEQRRGLEPGGPPLREPLPAISGPSTGEFAQPKGGEPGLYWDRTRSRWDRDSILRDVWRAYAIEVLIQEIERKGMGHTQRDPEGYFYDGAYYAGDLPNWRATQDGFIDRLRTLPRPVLQSAVLRVGLEAIRPPPTRFGPGGPFFKKPDLPPGGLTDLKDGDRAELPWYQNEQGQWNLKWIAKDIRWARRIADALARIRGGEVVADDPNDDPPLGGLPSEDGVYTAEDITDLEGLLNSIEDNLATVPIFHYHTAWDSAWAADGKPRRGEDPKGPVTAIPVQELPPLVPLEEIVINVDPSQLQLVPGFDPHPRGNRTTGQPDPWGGGPSPGPQRPPQRGVVAGQGGGGGGSSIGPNPGQGGTLVGGGGGQQGGGGYSPWGSSQQGGAQQGGGGSLGDPGGVRGGAPGSPDSPGGPGESNKGPDKGGETKDPKKDGETTKKGDDKGGSSGSDVKKTDDGKKDSSGSSGSGRVRGSVTIGEVRIEQDVVEEQDLPGGDPETGRGRGEGEDLRGRIAAHRPPGVTNQDADLVGRAFGKTTGADDKERPVTGGTSGSVSGNPSESRANDVGGLHVPRPGGGGEGGSAFEGLLRRLGLLEKWQAGGPDPPK